MGCLTATEEDMEGGLRCAKVCAGEMDEANDSIRVEHALSLFLSRSLSLLLILISVNCVLHLSKTFEYLMEIMLEKR